MSSHWLYRVLLPIKSKAQNKKYSEHSQLLVNIIHCSNLFDIILGFIAILYVEG